VTTPPRAEYHRAILRAHGLLPLVRP